MEARRERWWSPGASPDVASVASAAHWYLSEQLLHDTRQGFCLATKSESITFQYNPSFYVKADVDKIMLQMFQSDHRGSHVRDQ